MKVQKFTSRPHYTAVMQRLRILGVRVDLDYGTLRLSKNGRFIGAVHFDGEAGEFTLKEANKALAWAMVEG